MCKAMTMVTAMPSMGAILVPTVVHTADTDGDMRTTFTVKHAPALDFGHVHVMAHDGPNIKTETNSTARDLRRHPVSLG
jgi:hypothetical protein